MGLLSLEMSTSAEQWQPELMQLIQNGNELVGKVDKLIGSQRLLSLGRAALYAWSDEEEQDTLEGLEDLINRMNLPKPILNIFSEYLSWNRRCEAFFRGRRWLTTDEVRDFRRQRSNVSREIRKRDPDLQLVLTYVKDQVRILEDLLVSPPVRKERRTIPIPKKRVARRRLGYVLGSLLVFSSIDLVVLFVSPSLLVWILPIEISLFLGLPKLYDWIREH